MGRLERLGRGAVILALGIMLSGCISYESDGSNRYERISDVRKGATSAAWLLSLIHI